MGNEASKATTPRAGTAAARVLVTAFSSVAAALLHTGLYGQTRGSGLPDVRI